MSNQVPCRSQRMKGLPPEEDYPPFPPSPNNPSNEGTIDESIDSEVGSVAHFEHRLEGVVKNIKECFLSSINTPLNNIIGPYLVELPSSTRNFHQFSTFCQQMKHNSLFYTNLIVLATAQSHIPFPTASSL